MLEVHGGLLAWTVLTFVLLLVVLKKVAWGPILDALDARENEIKDALNAAEKAREEAERLSSNYEDSIRKAQAEAQRIISEAKTAGEKVKLDLETIANVKADEIIETAKEVKADVVGLSALLTTTMPFMKLTIEAIRDEGLDIPVIIGGAPVSQEFADNVDAHGYGDNAPIAVQLVKDLINAQKEAAA